MYGSFLFRPLRRVFGTLFMAFAVIALVQCARRGTPTGGPKDVTPPKLIKAEPKDMTINFKEKKIRLYFDEYIKLKDVQKQLIVSPPLKYTPIITPQGSPSKYVELTLKDTLKENTTYTLNFGQSIIDNNEGNPNSFLTYVFSTGTYIDSLMVAGAVKDAFKKSADSFISVMLYEMDSTYTDSTIYKRPPNYMTNTLDSAVVFRLKNLKAGKYAMFAIKDEGQNNMFDQKVDKIGFLNDTVTIPTDSTYLLTLFKEIPNYSVAVPSFTAMNKIIFGYSGNSDEIQITPMSGIPDSVRTMIRKEPNKDTLNFWFTPFDMDSAVFKVTNEKLKIIDTFTVKARKVGIDSLQLAPNQSGTLSFSDPYYITSTTTPIVKIDSSKISLFDKDTTAVNFTVNLDTLSNRMRISFKVEPNEKYNMELLPGAIEDFFGTQNDSLTTSLSTGSYADFGNLKLTVEGGIEFPVIAQLTDEKGELKREIQTGDKSEYEFNNLKPGKYVFRIIFDSNGNGKWDTGNYLERKQPEKVTYFPDVIELRANWEKNQTFILK
ncbi:Ig-like domain-containing protein [Flavobacteriaceae bacterium F89]|uniref:Ig-like domain-containing protein n=1 Tax=Cerina litoralis TaxID=2874477 RepID=A0AAE3JMQ2_9FLAO|nr:Ig-like domain-containing protein [Cerina litoralis]MCG2460140.1 Ig-like domain-containing protein [Cerina litoralis]